eukprot:7653576-Lingulodinium_polyedra.AAC.1
MCCLLGVLGGEPPRNLWRCKQLNCPNPPAWPTDSKQLACVRRGHCERRRVLKDMRDSDCDCPRRNSDRSARLRLGLPMQKCNQECITSDQISPVRCACPNTPARHTRPPYA